MATLGIFGTIRTRPTQRRRFQFRLRTLFLAAFVASVACAFAVRIERNRQQRLAGCEMWRLGGMVGDGQGTFYGPGGGGCWELDDLSLTDRAQQAILFDGACCTKEFSDHDVAKFAAIIRKFPTVEKVVFINTSVTPEWIERLRDALPDREISRSEL